VATPSNYGQTCGSCGGTIQCGGTCSIPNNCPLSCQGGGAGADLHCGANASSDCCGSSTVTGGTFDRGSNVLSPNSSYPASISTFRLDDFDVTVGRFRKFVAAWVGGYTPAANSGKHTHLNGGKGLAVVGTSPTTYEAGWSTDANSQLAGTPSAWTANLTSTTQPTWTASVGPNENLPIAGVDWYEAYAFCIWDGGFLPSTAEFLYAASGGSDQRVYPWSSPPSDTTLSCAFANYEGCQASPAIFAVGSFVPGNGKWGQSELSGNVWQWLLDYADFGNPCTDCYMPVGCSAGGCSDPSIRGGSYLDLPSTLEPANDDNQEPNVDTEVSLPSRTDQGPAQYGMRCARTP
jgi:sulfatase modifying factor 1